jgi:hypothetical protein
MDQDDFRFLLPPLITALALILAAASFSNLLPP